jgi:capsular polysaccharide biosynthesis protein
VVVGAHGAALSNLIWCRPGTIVVELLPASYQPAYFEHLSQTMGLSHHRLVEDGASEDEGHWTALGENQTVNIGRLEDLLATLLAG